MTASTGSSPRFTVADLLVMSLRLPTPQSFDDSGQFIELDLVNEIRPRVQAWRDANYPHVTGITRRLLEHWNDPDQREGRRFFFCQMEAIETLVWLTEAAPTERSGIEIPGDGGPFTRLSSKMATGSGKTIVMSILIAWQVLNDVSYSDDPRFSRNILTIAPGRTVRNPPPPPKPKTLIEPPQQRESEFEGKPNIDSLSKIDLEELGRKYRLQTIVFRMARDVFDQMQVTWQASKESLLAQVIRIVEEVLRFHAKCG